MDVGFIGLGLMGRPMALHLAKAGHTLHLWARRPDSLEPFRDTTAHLHVSAAEVARHADLVFTMVADAPDVEEVVFGHDGLVGGHAGAVLPRGFPPVTPRLTVVDMSTIAPVAAQSIGARLVGRGVRFLDAPVSGGEIGAINATLTIMVGGEPADFERVKPLLELLGKSVTLIGPIGAGQVAKAANQILTAVTTTAVAEALNFARKSGVDPARVREALLGGFAYSRILENHGQRMLDRNFKPGFKAWMHQKDLRIVMSEAHRLGLMLPNTAATAQIFNAVVGCGLGEEDSIAVLKLLEKASGQ
jgi:2-hydroxy-3-oxopropionate reductase